VLADYLDGRIIVDVDAGGRGWFVDQTPMLDEEFAGNGAVLTALSGGPAADRVDLLSVIAHEMGHAIGFGHSDDGVMDENRLPGERALPDGWFGLNAVSLEESPSLDDGAPRATRKPAAVQIDWQTPLVAAAAARSGATQASTERWQQRFVNHLGATPERLNPNAGFKVALPVAERLSRL